MHRIETWISHLTIAIGSLVLCLMVLQVVIDVFMRSVLGAGFPATAELVGKYYMVAVSFLPVAFTELRRRHVEALIFTEKLPQAAKTVVYWLGFVLSFLVYAGLSYGSAREAIRQTSRYAYVEAGTMHFYTWPSYWILPLAFGLMALVMGMRIITLAQGRFVDRSHDPLEELNALEEEG